MCLAFSGARPLGSHKKKFRLEAMFWRSCFVITRAGKYTNFHPYELTYRNFMAPEVLLIKPFKGRCNNNSFCNKRTKSRHKQREFEDC